MIITIAFPLQWKNMNQKGTQNTVKKPIVINLESKEARVAASCLAYPPVSTYPRTIPYPMEIKECKKRTQLVSSPPKETCPFIHGKTIIYYQLNSSSFSLIFSVKKIRTLQLRKEK